MADFIKQDAPLEAPFRILIIVAHPDDAEFGVAGSVARWISEGADVSYCIVTDGSAGSNDPDVQLDELVSLRRKEQTKAAATVGVEEVFFLGHPDGVLQPTMELRRDLTRVIREFKPDRVVCQDPTTIFYGDTYINHPDHRAAGEAALYAVFPSAETRPVFPELLDEGLEPHKVIELYVMLTLNPTVYVDTTDFIERKLAALRCHVSQLGEGEETEKGVIARVREWGTEGGERVGAGYVEFFRVMRFAPRSNNSDGKQDS